MKVVVFWLLALLLFVSPASAQYDSLIAGGIYTSDFTIDELPRSITYYMPQQYGKEDKHPLLICLHPDSSNARKLIKAYGDLMHAKADEYRCVVMYPDALHGHWNSNFSADAAIDTINDASFLTIMLQFFVQQYGCDARHIYLLGFGNGGLMCYRYTCERPDNIAAVAAIGTATGDSLKSCLVQKEIPVFENGKETDQKNAIGKLWDELFSKDMIKKNTGK